MADPAAPPARKRRLIVWIVLPVLLCAGAGTFAFLKLRARDVRYYNRGELYFESGDTVRALSEFRAAVALNPKFLEARLGLVRVLIARKELTKALSEVDRAVENGLAENEAELLKAKVYSAAADQLLAEAGETLSVTTCEKTIAADVDPAIELVARCADQAQDPSEAYSQLGDIYAQKSRIAVREWEILVREYNQARQLQRSDEATAKKAEILAARLKVRSVQNGAVAAYSEAVRRDPAAVHPRVGIARYAVAAYLPRPQQAREILQPLMSRKPVPADALQCMAIAEWYDGNYDRAVEQYRRIIASHPKFLRARSLLAESYQRNQRVEKAVEVLEDSLTVAKPEDAGTIQLLLGRIYEDQGRLEPAIASYRAAMSQDSAKARALNNLAMLPAQRPEFRHAARRTGREAGPQASGDSGHVRLDPLPEGEI